MPDHSRRTQMTRTTLSAPTRHILEALPLSGWVLHHGVGKAALDTYAMETRTKRGVAEYDPNVPGKDNRIVLRGRRYDYVVSNYVLNVLRPFERNDVIWDIVESLKPGGVAYITVRSYKDKSIKGRVYADGVVTTTGTFQKGFTRADLIEELTGWFSEVEIIWESGSSLMARAMA